MRPFRHDQFTAPESLDSRLHGALGQACSLGDVAQACGCRSPALAGRHAIQVKEYEKRRGLFVMPDEIPQQDIEHVCLNRHGAFWRGHAGQGATIPLNGQLFFSARRFWGGQGRMAEHTMEAR